MEQETYLERIKKLKSSRRLTNDKLSELTGIPLGTLSKLLAGISDSPKLSNIVAISRALDCSLDWLITGVPENTNNYTLTSDEITLVEVYRTLDAFGRDLTMTVMAKERDRAERQADVEAIRLHELARRSARRGGSRVRRPSAETDPAAAFTGNVFRYAASAAQTAETAKSATAAETALPAAVAMAERTAPMAERTAPMAERAATTDGKTAPTVGTSTAAAEKSAATILSVPRSGADRSTTLPSGLRRRNIALYDMAVSAGSGEFLSDSARTDIVIPDDARTAEADYALRINGNSMEPKYHSGDILLIQTTESVEAGELGIFVLDGSGYFKKYGGDHLISLNPDYPPIMLKDFESAACCGRVVGKLKKK